MEIFPAIDLRNGQVVRLTQGDYDQMEVYASNPAEIARQFKKIGARNLHVVDLDGAKDGTLANFEAIRSIAEEGGLFMEVGGGIRDEQRIQTYLELGVNRVILGSAAITNFPFLQEMVKQYGEKIAVGVDAKDGMVAIHGWKEVTDTDAVDFCRTLRDVGVRTVIYTDISKDGGLQGTNLEIYRTLHTIQGLSMVASGGISFLDEITALKEMGIDAAIVGKAVYTGKLDLSQVLALAE